MYRLFNVLCWFMEYIRGSGAPECIFSNKHKHCMTYLALIQLFPVLVSHPEMYTLCSILLLFCLGVSHFFFSHGYLHMGQMDFISSIFVRLFFQNYLGSISLITRYRCIGWSIPLFVHSTLILKQWRHWDQHVYSCAIWSCCLYQKAFRDKQCNFWPGFNVNVQPGQCFCSRLFSVKQLTFEISIILCEYSYHSFI